MTTYETLSKKELKAAEKVIKKETLKLAMNGLTDCLLWSTVGFEGEHLDEMGYQAEDIRKSHLIILETTLASFMSVAEERKQLYGFSPSAIGHNFWLTWAGHGSGFFDSASEYADELDGLAMSFQRGFTEEFHADPYIDDDNTIQIF
tara:strand:+ start:352 stop:792 length:441 start_codon:yes stop_codon:yes gene_type:complete